MKRLEKLKFEKEIAKQLTCLPFHMRPLINEYYEREIDAIEKYGSANSEVSIESLSEIEKIMEAVYGDKKAE